MSPACTLVRLAVFAALLGCSGGGGAEADQSGAEEPAALVDPDRWQVVAEASDPFPSRGEEDVRCNWADLRPESGGIEINTEACNTVTLAQPLLDSLAQGERLHWLMWWQTLASAAPAQGHLALAIDGEPLWRREVAIPGPADVVDTIIPVPAAFPRGATLYVHVSNHGYNSWNVNRIERTQ